MKRILLIVIAIIVYGSLYPWDFHSTPLAASPPWILIHSWPTAINRFVILDVAVNLLLYMPLGVFAFLAFRQNLGSAVAATAAMVIGLVLSSSIEMIQLFDDARECSALDVVSNVTGTGIGVVLGTFHQRWLKHSVSRTETASFLHPNGAVLLTYAWIAYQAFPLFPALSRTRLAAKLRVLFVAVSVSPQDTFTYFVEWLVLAQLLAAVVGTAKTRKFLPLLILVLPARLFITGRTFTPQKPVRRAYEQNPTAVRKWLGEEYPSIRAQARQFKAQIHWLDEMGLRSDHQAGRCYGRRGQTPVVFGTGQRFRCNMISSITNRGRLAFMILRQRFTARVFLNFLGRLLRLTRKTRRKVFLVVDGHPVHKARSVSRWLAEHGEQIRIFYLPSYSPELNPYELLNQGVKTNALGRVRPINVQEMMDNVRSYLRITQARPAVVKNYFRERHVRYAAS